MKKQPSALVEFGVIILLLAAVVVFVWSADFSFGTTTKTNDTEEKKKEKVTANNSPEYAAWKEGKDLFKSNCAACHNPKADGTGPALKGSLERWNTAGEYQGKSGEQWLKAWIKNWNDPVNAGYKYAVDMANSRISEMNRFPYLKDTEIDLIMNYVNAPEGPVATAK